MELVLTGDIITAKHALELGLITQVVNDDELNETCDKLAQKLAKKSPLALQIGKEGLNRLADSNHYDQGLDSMDDLFATLCATQDATEGVTAFLEKRPPVWQEK